MADTGFAKGGGELMWNFVTPQAVLRRRDICQGLLRNQIEVFVYFSRALSLEFKM